MCVNGSCYCEMVRDPYNNTFEYFPLMGEDCSFLIPFAGARVVLRPSALVAVIAAVAVLVNLLL